MVDVIIFLGAPGSGKGTQAKRLSQNHPTIFHLSTGDILRLEIKKKSEIGKKIEHILATGNLIPDDLMIEIIEHTIDALTKTSVKKIILDGFPRTLHQVETLDKSKKAHISNVIFFNVPHERLLVRLSSRRICENCGALYNMNFCPPKNDSLCDLCGAKLLKRKDDSFDVAQHRLELFLKQNESILDFYTKKGLLRDIDADVSVSDLEKKLEPFFLT